MSSVEQASLRGTLLDHGGRLSDLERSGSPRIYVGTVGVDGIDDLISPLSPPYENGATVSTADGVDPVWFTRHIGWTVVGGGYTPPAPGLSICTLPVGFRPGAATPDIITSSDGTAIYSVIYLPNGQIVHVGQLL